MHSFTVVQLNATKIEYISNMYYSFMSKVLVLCGYICLHLGKWKVFRILTRSSLLCLYYCGIQMQTCKTYLNTAQRIDFESLFQPRDLRMLQLSSQQLSVALKEEQEHIFLWSRAEYFLALGTPCPSPGRQARDSNMVPNKNVIQGYSGSSRDIATCIVCILWYFHSIYW